MGIDFEKELEEIKKNIKEIYENIDMKNINRHVSNTVHDIMKSFNMNVGDEPREQKNKEKETEPGSKEMDEETKELLRRIQDNHIKMRDTNHNTGYVSYCGTFASSDRESKWVYQTQDTDGLLTLIENKSAVKVLNCIGNSMRLDILLAIMKQPMTVAQLVEHFGSNSTGQIYHHLGPLMTADLIVEDPHNKGVYIVQPHRVQGIIMLLAGIKDMTDTKYTEGDWTPES